jgi:hypothetical protein
MLQGDVLLRGAGNSGGCHCASYELGSLWSAILPGGTVHITSHAFHHGGGPLAVMWKILIAWSWLERAASRLRPFPFGLALLALLFFLFRELRRHSNMRESEQKGSGNVGVMPKDGTAQKRLTIYHLGWLLEEDLMSCRRGECEESPPHGHRGHYRLGNLRHSPLRLP